MTSYPSISHSNECKRCRLQHNLNEVECPHCSNLSDKEALKLKKAFKKHSIELNSNLGKTFKILFVIIILIMVLIYLL